MRKHPGNRYASMDALLADLDCIAGDQTRRLSRRAMERLEHDPDVYKPRHAKGRGVAEYLATYFGTEPPPPPSIEYLPGYLLEPTGLDD